MDAAELLKKAQELAPEIREIRRQIHANPETGMDTEQTAMLVKEKLREMGYDPRDIGTNGVTATIGKQGKTFLLRADMDALKMDEESGLPFASQKSGAAHCCGHDMHTAMLLGAAKLLKMYESELNGTVKLLFQPGEENMQGARNMIEAGILENPRVDAAMSLHVNSVVPTGRLLVFTGPACASSDLFTITIKGRGGHGSTPNKTIDPLNVAAHIHIALQEIQARELAAGEMGVLTIGCIKGGETFNVIPSEAVMMGTIRTYSKEVRQRLISRMQVICESIAAAFRAEATVTMHENYTIPMISDAEVATEAREALGRAFPAEQIKDMRKSFPGSEDFAFIADKVPAVLVILGATVDPKTPYGQHHPKVRFDEACLPVGCAAEVQVAMEWLRNNSL